MVLVAHEHEIEPAPIGRGGDLRDALQDRPLKIELEHYAEGTRETRIHDDREVQRQHSAGFEQFFEWWQRPVEERIGEADSWTGLSGSSFNVVIPDGALHDGGTYAWRVQGVDDVTSGPWSDWCEFNVDTTRPDKAPTVTSEDYPPTDAHGGPGVPGTFTFTANGVEDAVEFRYGPSTDQITSAAGRIADRHQHPGPGIRCLVEGTFNAEQAGHSARNLYPGDAWWETGPDTVVAWGSRQMPAKFLRGMVLPTEWEGKVTGTWLSPEATRRPSNWRLIVDKVISF